MEGEGSRAGSASSLSEWSCDEDGASSIVRGDENMEGEGSRAGSASSLREWSCDEDGA